MVFPIVCQIIVKHKQAMCFVNVILRQLLALLSKLLFVCLCNFLSLLRNCRELLKKGALLSGCSQLILPQNGYPQFCWDVSVHPFCFFLSHIFVPCILFLFDPPSKLYVVYWNLIACLYNILLYAAIPIGTSHYILCQCPHVAWLKPMACQLCLSACCISNENCF